MTIREVSAMTGMREDTLRYYEQIGVIPQVPRNKWGVRTYQEPVLQKIFLVQKLKAAGMPLKGHQAVYGSSCQGGAAAHRAAQAAGADQERAAAQDRQPAVLHAAGPAAAGRDGNGAIGNQTGKGRIL